MAKQKIHLRDPKVPIAPLCCCNRDLQLTDDPDQVTCGNCLRMMERERMRGERQGHEKEKG